MASRPYKTSNYLKSPQDRIAYLNEALESEDFKLFLYALKNVAEITDVKLNDAKYESSDFSNLNGLLHSIGLRLTVQILENKAKIDDT